MTDNLRPMPHGATPDQLEAFLINLANTGVVAKSCRAAGITKYIVYERRKEDATFARRWDEALTVLPSRVLDAMVEEAIEGEPILNVEGVVVGHKRNTRLLERLAEKHGVIDPQRPQVAIQNNVQQQAANDPAVLAYAKRNEQLLTSIIAKARGRQLAQVIDVTPIAALPDPDHDLI